MKSPETRSSVAVRGRSTILPVMRPRLCLALATALTLAGTAARADEAEGRRLYEEGKTAMAARDFATACPKFKASYESSDKPGALLSWADCEEARGRIGTALELWQKGAALVKDDAERAAFVQARVAALEVRVPKLTVKVPPTVAYAKARIDGREITLGAPIPLDPGSHEIIAEAPSQAPESRRVDLTPGTVMTIELLSTVVPVAKTTPEPVRAPEPDAAAEPDAGLVTAGWIVGGVGLAGAIGFGITGGLLLDTCHGTLDPCGGAEGRDADKALALTRSNMALGVIGLAGLGAGAVLLGVGYTSGSKPGSASAQLRVGLGHVALGGSF